MGGWTRRWLRHWRFRWHMLFNKWAVTEHDDIGRIYILSTHMTEKMARRYAAIEGPQTYVRWTEDAMGRRNEQDFG
jgi:hypothetical protein